MFFGIPGSAPLAVAAGAREVTFEFTAVESAETGTMHFRFGTKPGTVDLDDIHVVDLDDGREVIPRADFEAGPAVAGAELDDLAAGRAEHRRQGRGQGGRGSEAARRRCTWS